jgi:D-erythro-7,8-dihydroneopterin triphosphate epimerase
MPSQTKAKRFTAADLAATIHIRNLRLRTFIGFNPEEREKQQDIIINIEIRHQVSGHALRDHVDEALNYKTVTKSVIALVEGGRFLLLEKLVADVLAICSEHPSVLATNRMRSGSPIQLH